MPSTGAAGHKDKTHVEHAQSVRNVWVVVNSDGILNIFMDLKEAVQDCCRRRQQTCEDCSYSSDSNGSCVAKAA